MRFFLKWESNILKGFLLPKYATFRFIEEFIELI